MKRIISLFIATILSTSLWAQCDKIFDFQEGTNWTWSNYDKKGKLIGKTIQKVSELSITGANRTAVMSVVTSDAKGKQTDPISMEMACKDGVIYVDMKKFIPQEQLEGADLELSVDASNLELPQDMKVGDKLEDASITMNLSGDSPVAMNMTITITDRQVLAEEKLNTSAGAFDCLVMKQKIKTKMMMSYEMESKDWYAIGVGMVKSETYRKGKLNGYSLLTTFSR